MSYVIKFKQPNEYYTPVPQNGIELEGRKTRKGLNSMEIGSLCSYWEASDLRWFDHDVDDLPFPVKMLSYRIELYSFISLGLIDEVKRYDTISSWYLSYQEELLHLARALKLIDHDLHPKIKALIEAEAENIYNVICNWLDALLEQGDYSFEQFEFYVKDHKDSASPFGMKWKDLLDNPKKLRQAHAVVNKWIKEYVTWYKHTSMKPMTIRLIKASLTYPALRGRPGDAQVISQEDQHIVLMISKWRDRKVGGIGGLSQLTYGYYKNDRKHKINEVFYQYYRQVLGIEVKSLSQEGLPTYIYLMEHPELYLYDMKNAEKSTGMYLSFLGFSVDLSDPRFPPEVAAEMYSGIGPTSMLNELMIVLILRVMIDEHLIDPKLLVMFSDNLALDVELPATPYFDVAKQFCGLNHKVRRFEPVSFVTDNPDHSVGFINNHQKQVQRVQYIMRPFMTLLLNDILRQDTTYKFFKWVEARKLNISKEASERKDHIKDMIMHNVDIHENLLDEFSEITKFVESAFITQRTNAQRSTDLKIY